MPTDGWPVLLSIDPVGLFANYGSPSYQLPIMWGSPNPDARGPLRAQCGHRQSLTVWPRDYFHACSAIT